MSTATPPTVNETWLIEVMPVFAISVTVAPTVSTPTGEQVTKGAGAALSAVMKFAVVVPTGGTK